MLKLSPTPILWWQIRRRAIKGNRLFLKEYPFRKTNKILKKQKTCHTEAEDASMTGIILLITCLSSICRRLHNSLSSCSFFRKRHHSLPLEKEAVLFSCYRYPLEITELVIRRERSHYPSVAYLLHRLTLHHFIEHRKCILIAFDRTNYAFLELRWCDSRISVLFFRGTLSVSHENFQKIAGRAHQRILCPLEIREVSIGCARRAVCCILFEMLWERSQSFRLLLQLIRIKH